MSTKSVQCGTCGEVFLTPKQYSNQMSCADALWFCPKCGKNARFHAEYSPCLQCETLVDHENDECPKCGVAQRLAYTEMVGDDDEES